MGTMGAEGMAEAINSGLVSLDGALVWHLQSNHFPPLPLTMIPIAKAAIEALNDEHGERQIAISDTGTMSAHQLADALHLWAFVNDEDDEYVDEDTRPSDDR